MRTLVVDVGGAYVKVLASGQTAPREFVSGPALTAEQMVAGVKTVAVQSRTEPTLAHDSSTNNLIRRSRARKDPR